MRLQTPETSNRPEWIKIPKEKLDQIKDLSKKDLDQIMRMNNKAEVENALNQEKQWKDFEAELAKNESYKVTSWDIIIKIWENWWMLPVSVVKDWKLSQDKESINNKIAAMQKYNPNTPEVKAMIDKSMCLIDDAVKKWIVDEDPNNEDYAAFCMYAANRSIKELHPSQNEAANEQVIKHAVEHNWWIVEQQKIDAAGWMVCKDFAPTFATIMNKKNIWISAVVARESESHMFAIWDYPWMPKNFRVDAWANTDKIMNNKAVMLYEKMEKLWVLEWELNN